MEIVTPSVELLWITPKALETIELSGRVCYKSEDKICEGSAERFYSVLSQKGHASVIEHASASVRIVCDRGVSHELVRHRLSSFSQESTRYVNYTKERHGSGSIKFLLPTGLTPEQEQIFRHGFELTECLYIDAIKAGCTPQQARALLPHGLKTELVMTCNFRQWLHVLNLRLDKAAHPDIRIIAGLIQALLAKEVPRIFEQVPK